MKRIAERIEVIAVVTALWTACLMGETKGQNPSSDYAAMEDACPVLDAPRPGWAEVSLGTVLPAEVTPGAYNIGLIEAAAGGRLFYLENDLGADLEGRIQAQTTWMLGFDNSDLSYALTMAQVCLQYSQRFEYGLGLRLDVAPGLHAGGSEFSNAWTMPVGGILVYDFNPHVALYGGVLARLGFSNLWDPRVGLCFTTGDRFRFDLAYPETSLDWIVIEGFSLVAGVRYQNQMEYGLGDDPRERLGVTEARAFVGCDIGVTESSALTLRVGYVLGRTLWFEKESEEYDLGNAMSIQLGWAGRF